MASLSQFGLFVVLLHIVFPSTCDGIHMLQTTNSSSDILLNIPTRLVALEQTMAIIVGEFQADRSSNKKKFHLKEDIIADINQGRFAFAEEKMLELNDPATVADIVREIAENSDHDFGVLVNLAKSVNNTSLKTQILTNLYYKARASDHITTLNLIALAKCLSETGEGSPQKKVIGIVSFKKLLDKIAENTITTFVDVVEWRGDYQTNAEVRALAAGIAEWPDVSKKVMTGLVSGMLANVDSKDILEAVSGHDDAWQALMGVGALIDQLKDTDAFKGSIALRIAVKLNEIINRNNLEPIVQAKALDLKEKVPECIRNLTKLTDFRIWNKHTSSFLAFSGYYFVAPLASIVIAQPKGNCNHLDTWRLYNFPNKKLILRPFDHKDTLQASDVSHNGFHRVFIAKAIDPVVDDKHAWMLEPAGDSCFLRNHWNNEYLYASDAKFSEDDRKIAGTMARRGSGSAHDNPEFTWQFRDC